jgi:hypothetical protein
VTSGALFRDIFHGSPDVALVGAVVGPIVQSHISSHFFVSDVVADVYTLVVVMYVEWTPKGPAWSGGRNILANEQQTLPSWK